MQSGFRGFFVGSALLFLSASTVINGQKLEKKAAARLAEWNNPVKEWRYPEKIKIDSLKLSETDKTLNIYFPPELSQNAVREEALALLEHSVKETLSRRYESYSLRFYSNGFTLDQLVPNYYRRRLQADSSRFPITMQERPVLIRRQGAPATEKGLYQKNIAIWHSHGYYYDMTLDRWEWQRAKLFGTVEDVSVMGYVLPYLARMLEKSGAIVYLPRERDTQVNEVIVDNDRSTGDSKFIIHPVFQEVEKSEGFLMTDTLFAYDNPFKKGTSVRISGGIAEYIPEIPATGNYAVYISYPRRRDNTSSASYTVIHSGGETGFVIDQTIGGSTWIYLGTFHFLAGRDSSRGSVRAAVDGSGILALDAVKFGGGMGSVARKPSQDFIANQRSVNASEAAEGTNPLADSVNYTWKLSGKPRYIEGARYYLQYAGMPDTTVYTMNRNRNDYNDDYMSRGEWVNYLMGAPNGPSRDPMAEGLGIPVDLSLAFHTDAGITPDDSIIGTLGIYSTATGNGKFPDGTSRMASRDLTDMIQTQIVDDISKLFNPEWTRRGLWDRPYYEARRPNVPAMLLELLSHQNLGDQKYGLDPRFRFHVSRAVYKGMLRYIAYVENRDPVVAPLPVDHMAITPLGGRQIRLSWSPVADPLEPSAMPLSYRVYSRQGETGFNNGDEVRTPYFDLELEHYDTIYSFMVTALNEGGESLESETLSVGIKPGSDRMVLVVSGFDRISGPAWFDRSGMGGVEWWNDRGVADHYDIATIGDQYDFYRESPWTDDDNAGWGASWSDMEGKLIAGNTFDFPYTHGKAIMAAGRSFCSVSDEVFCSENFNASPYEFIDIILGEEKTTMAAADSSERDFRIYTPEFINALHRAEADGIPIFMSGSYVGTDLQIAADTALTSVVGDLLHFKPRTGHAVKNGKFYSTDIASPFFRVKMQFRSDITGEKYAAESPDAIEPADKSSATAFRYSENNTSAGVIHTGKTRTVVLGFPFETITEEGDRYALMKQIVLFLKHNE